MSENAYCPNCSKPIAQDDVFCRFCGVGLTNSEIKDKIDSDTSKVASDYLLEKIQIEPYESKESEELKDTNDKLATNNKLLLTIAFAVFGVVFYLLVNPTFLDGLLHPTYKIDWGLSGGERTYYSTSFTDPLPGFIVTIILMSVVGFITGLAADNQKKEKK